MTTTIKDLGEIELLNRLKKFMRYGQIDDDVAEISTINKSLLINTDLLVEKIHFLMKYLMLKILAGNVLPQIFLILLAAAQKI